MRFHQQFRIWGWYCLLLWTSLLSACVPRTEDVVYVLPDGFQGNVIIVFGQPMGAKPEYAADFRVYRIPPSGILKTQFRADHSGYAKLAFCYASQFQRQGNIAHELPYINQFTPATTSKLLPQRVVCFELLPVSQGEVVGELFTVSNRIKADSIYAIREDFMAAAFQ